MAARMRSRRASRWARFTALITRLGGALGRIQSGRHQGVHFQAPPSVVWERRGSHGGTAGVPMRSMGALPVHFLTDVFPGVGVALKRVGLGLFLVADLLVEPAGDHLVGH